MRRNSKLVVVLLILLISIGFAFLSSQLDLIGSTLLRKQEWDIHFESPTKVGGNVDANSLTLTNTTTVNFSVDLLQPKDTYEFTVDVVNDGSIDGMISSISGTELTTNQKKVFEYVITYDDGSALKEKQLLAHNSSDKYKVTVRYKDDISSSDLSIDNQTVNITITVNYVQADDTAINRVTGSFISLYNQETPGVLAQGDEVNIGDEHFYIVTIGTNKYALLAKYNLYVGRIYTNGEYTTIQTTANGYGLQSKYAKGVLSNNNSYAVGTVPFSGSKYWWDNGIKEKYGTNTNYNNDIYDSDYISSSGSNYSIAYYVQDYLSKLQLNYSATIIKARLLTYNEAYSYGCRIGSTYSCPSSFLTTSSYWVGTAGQHDNNSVVIYINSSNRFDVAGYTTLNNFGVRPVIEVSNQYL